MNRIYTHPEVENLPVLEWRRHNVQYMIENYIPYILNHLNTKKSEVTDIRVGELTNQFSTEGFTYNNLKLLSFKLKTNRGEFDINVKLPVPSDDDIFIINRKHYILVNIFQDDIYYIFNKGIYSVAFRIDDQGNWFAYKGSQSKSQVGTPLVQVLYSLDILTDWLPGFRITPNDETVKGKTYSYPTEKGDFITFDHVDHLHDTPAQNLIISSIIKLKKPENLEKDKQAVLDKLEKQNPFEYSLIYGFTKGYTDLPTLYNNILMDYREEYFIPNEIHLKFKRVGYYETVLKPFENKIKSIANIFARAKNVDISWHQKIPTNIITKALRTDKNLTKYLQYLEFRNIFNEDLKHKCIISLNNVPKYLRNTMYSARDYYAIDPLNTPDSKQIGIVQHLTYMTQLDDYGYFIKPNVTTEQGE